MLQFAGSYAMKDGDKSGSAKKRLKKGLSIRIACARFIMRYPG
jgi:hypothetical protein